MIASCLLCSAILAPKTPTLLVLNKGDNTVSLINMESGKLRKNLPTGSNPNEVATSPDGTIAAISDMGVSFQNPGKTLTFIKIDTAEVVNTINIEPHSMPHGVTWISNSKLVYTSHTTDSLVEFDTKTNKIVRAIKTEQKGTHLAVFNPEFSKAFAVNAFSGSVTAIDFTNGIITKQIPTGDRAEGISIAPNQNWVACGNVGADTVSLIDPKTLSVTKTLEGISAPIRTAFTNDSKFLLVSSVGAGVVRVFDTTHWSKVTDIELKQKPIANPQYGNQWPTPMNFWVRKNGNILVVLVTSHAVAEIEPNSWKVVRTYDTGPVPDGICVSE